MFPLLSHGILGLNARNLLYLKPFNPKKAVAFADDKLKTKAFLSARGIPVAKIYARIENRSQLRSFDFGKLPDECVLKPNYGFGGEGIMILQGRRNGLFLEQGKTPVTEKRLVEHIEDILEGEYSVNGRRDTAFFEKILVSDECFATFRPAGLPDIRIVVFNLVPVMAMLRVPTAASHGKANVHMGGIGIGIDIAKGVTTHAFQYNAPVSALPHGASPSGIPIPHWHEMLLIASRIQAMTNIGYLAVDLTLDKDQGPTLLEVNARAGLSLQIANLAPLRSRLQRVQGLSVGTPEKGVRIAQDLFGEKIEREAGDDRPVLGLRENILLTIGDETVEVPCLLQPQEESSAFDPDLLEELGLEEAGEGKVGDEKAYHVKFTLGGQKIQTVVRGRTMPLLSVRAVIGRRDLTSFLIDPAKKAASASLVRVQRKAAPRVVDRLLAQADHDLVLLKFLKPINLWEERNRLERDPRYSPFFLYPELPGDLSDLEQRLSSSTNDDSPLGMLLAKKRQELVLRIALLRTRGDARAFTAASQALFGTPDAALLHHATSFLQSRKDSPVEEDEGPFLTATEAAAIFSEILERYVLHDWQVTVRANLIADCTVGAKRLYVRQGAQFSRVHVDSLIAHEIETHIFTAENGNQQPFDLFRRGFAHYLDTQEGLAVHNQNRVLPPHHQKRYGPARSVVAAAYALKHSFVDTRHHLEHELGYGPEKALTKTIELKRGLHDTAEPGAFTKGIVYFRGQKAVEDFLGSGGDLRRLYIGKVSLEDLELAERIPGVKRPMLIPMYLRGKQEEEKIT